MTPLTIAKRTRRIVEKWARELPGIYERDLACGCGAASYTLWRALRAVGYDATLYLAEESVGGGSHCLGRVRRLCL